MAKKEKTVASESAKTPEEQMSELMDETKEDHFNYVTEVDYRISSGSLILDRETDGGLGPGFHRLVGHNNSGKTPLALEYQINFLKYHKKNNQKARGLLIRAEGKLNKLAMSRLMSSGDIKYVTDPNDWKDGTVLIIHSQKYETLAYYIGQLIRNNPHKYLYNIIIDSMDGLKVKVDEGKKYEDSQKTAGVASISKRFLTDFCLEFNVLGHQGILISQVTATIAFDAKTKASMVPKDGNYSGGNALMHFANWILEFKKIYKSNMELDSSTGKINDGVSTVLAHTCAITIGKSMLENKLKTIEYKVKHNVTSGSAVWVADEIKNLMLRNEYIKKSGSWFELDKNVLNNLKKENLEMPERIQGDDNVVAFLDENPPVLNYFFEHFRSLILVDSLLKYNEMVGQ